MKCINFAFSINKKKRYLVSKCKYYVIGVLKKCHRGVQNRTNPINNCKPSQPKPKKLQKNVFGFDVFRAIFHSTQ